MFKFLFFSLFITTTIWSFSQEIPSDVEKSFNSMFSSAINVEWSRTDDFYEVAFIFNDEMKLTRFDKDGKWVFTKTEMVLENQLPVQVRKAIKSQYPDGYASRFQKIENNDKSLNYEVEISLDDNSYLVLIDSSGKILNTQKVEVAQDERNVNQEE
ncbi:MAG: PepSY-like domain-containing protein [Bacteroidia bacterium]|nr:PepSY-like domain-containing protein [Bacteroidia bacterium]